MKLRVSLKCAIEGCPMTLRMSREERVRLREEGAAEGAEAGVICPKHVQELFELERNEFRVRGAGRDETIGVAVPLEELLVESLRKTPEWRVLLTPAEPSG